MLVVADTSPFIGLIKIGQVGLVKILDELLRRHYEFKAGHTKT